VRSHHHSDNEQDQGGAADQLRDQRRIANQAVADDRQRKDEWQHQRAHPVQRRDARATGASPCRHREEGSAQRPEERDDRSLLPGPHRGLVEEDHVGDRDRSNGQNHEDQGPVESRPRQRDHGDDHREQYEIGQRVGERDDHLQGGPGRPRDCTEQQAGAEHQHGKHAQSRIQPHAERRVAEAVPEEDADAHHQHGISHQVEHVGKAGERERRDLRRVIEVPGAEQAQANREQKPAATVLADEGDAGKDDDRRTQADHRVAVVLQRRRPGLGREAKEVVGEQQAGQHQQAVRAVAESQTGRSEQRKV
jgi:hypothetical protein